MCKMWSYLLVICLIYTESAVAYPNTERKLEYEYRDTYEEAIVIVESSWTRAAHLSKLTILLIFHLSHSCLERIRPVKCVSFLYFFFFFFMFNTK